jgi:hypothetical protein
VLCCVKGNVLFPAKVGIQATERKGRNAPGVNPSTGRLMCAV